MLGRVWFTVAVAALLVGACGSSPGALASPSPTRAIRATLKAGGLERAYYLLQPPNRKGGLPLVLALHGYTQSPQGLEFETKFDGEAVKNGFVVIYPEGISQNWNSSDSGGDAQMPTVDDVGFMRQIIDRMVSTGLVDPKRVFATGISSGGEMSHRLACELSDRIAAVASVSGDLGISVCHPGSPVSVLEIHGTADPFVPMEGDPLNKIPPTLSSMNRWVQIDGCAVDPAVTVAGIMTTTTWASCHAGTSVVLVTITGAGHTFWLEPITGQPDINTLIWAFLSRAPPRE